MRDPLAVLRQIDPMWTPPCSRAERLIRKDEHRLIEAAEKECARRCKYPGYEKIKQIRADLLLDKEE